MIEKKLHLEAGVPDWDGSIYSEDRYIILMDGMDLLGFHLSLEEADDFLARTLPS